MGDGAAVCVRWRGWAAQSVEDRALPGVVQPDHHHLVLAAAKDAVVQVREAGAHGTNTSATPAAVPRDSFARGGKGCQRAGAVLT